MRLDIYLVEKGFCGSRNKAKDFLLNGGVKINGNVILKPSFLIANEDVVEINQNALMPYVSKGGLKLEKAIRVFSLDFKRKFVIDIGASTGGFTDCALKHGAEFVWAVDVGNGQMVDELRFDGRVKSIENTDFRRLTFETIGRKVDFIVGDLSFISLKHILEFLPNFLEPAGCAVLLIKPQFEVGPENVGKGGIVKSPKKHITAIFEIADFAKKVGLYLNNLTAVPLVDSRKNIEYLALFKMNQECFPDIDNVVKMAFRDR